MSVGVLLLVFVLRSEPLLLRLNVSTANSLPWVSPTTFSSLVIIPYCVKRSFLDVVVWLRCLLIEILTVAAVTDVCETTKI